MTATAPPETPPPNTPGSLRQADSRGQPHRVKSLVRVGSVSLRTRLGGPDPRTTAAPACSVVEAGRLGAKAAQDLGVPRSVRTDRLKALICVRAFARVCRWVAPDVSEPRSPALAEHMLSRHPN
jgi:hypothetical protein